MKTAIVLGAGGFIGHHLVSRLKEEGFYVVGTDLKLPEFSNTKADRFIVGDLRNQIFCEEIFNQSFDEVYQLAADMGGAGYVFTGDNDADIMHNSAQININVAKYTTESKCKKIFYSSSACVYPEYIQVMSDCDSLKEEDAYPAKPDSEYGWEKLFSERLYKSYQRNYGLNIRIARFHNIFGPEGTWQGGKEKAPAAICRKVIENDSSIEIWGDGEQTRSFLYIDECLDGIRKLMDSDCYEVVNIGSDERVSINELANMAMEFKGKKLDVKHIPGPIGVRGRNSNNTFIYEKIGWKPSTPLKEGLKTTYLWIERQINK
jgi:GDP-D-mannose 3', 5'-epimerase